ncbi:flavin reductase family protein [soil metagenome]
MGPPGQPEASAAGWSTAFDSARFRLVLGHYPTGVVVITAVVDDEPVGLAIGSFASVSLDPPLVLFCVHRLSASWARITGAGVFCVNVLAEDQEQLSRTFAARGVDRFEGVGWRPGGTGAPILDDVIAWMECEIERVEEAGDHVVVVGRVVDLDVERPGGPLVFFRGGYGRYTH